MVAYDTGRIAGCVRLASPKMKGTLQGKSPISVKGTLKLDDQHEWKLGGRIRYDDVRLKATLRSRQFISARVCFPLAANPYDGDYHVVPKVYEQTLSTKNKTMTGNVVIEKIPCAEVDNSHGGTTVIIGGE